ncbi:MAG: hypothetical protein QY328_09600 [Anaerolineales bacterium]|nr:MAG: hypothetical protein QY328_09600 [Anaerolineales bacterium]
MTWLNQLSKLSVVNLVLGLALLVFGLTSSSLILIVYPALEKAIIVSGILLTASGIYIDIKQGWLAHINIDPSSHISYLEATAISFIVALMSMIIPLFLGFGIFLIPLFLWLVLPISLLGASIGYFTKRQTWVWVGSVFATILSLVFAFLAFYFLALIGQSHA